MAPIENRKEQYFVGPALVAVPKNIRKKTGAPTSGGPTYANAKMLQFLPVTGKARFATEAASALPADFKANHGSISPAQTMSATIKKT